MKRHAARLKVLLRRVTMPTGWGLADTLIGSTARASRCCANVSRDNGSTATNLPVANNSQYISIELHVTGAVGRAPRGPNTSSTRALTSAAAIPRRMA